MKKTLSVILAVVMLITMSVSAINVFAEGETCECGCADCTMVMGTCHCCVDCPYLDFSYLLDCSKDETTGHFKGFGCCAECRNIWPCECGSDCGCEYCVPGDEEAPDPIQPVIPPEAQNKIIQIFQDIMRTLNDVINNIFEKFYELLGIQR